MTWFDLNWLRMKAKLLLMLSNLIGFFRFVILSWGLNRNIKGFAKGGTELLFSFLSSSFKTNSCLLWLLVLRNKPLKKYLPNLSVRRYDS